MDSVGTASIDIGSADKSNNLSLVKYRFTPWYDDNSGNYPLHQAFCKAEMATNIHS